jgi:hypothetical protein
VLREFLANESISLSGLRGAIADVEKEHMVAIAIAKLATGRAGGIAEAKGTVVKFFQLSREWTLQIWDAASEKVPPRQLALRRVQTFADWSASTEEELEHEEKHFVALVHRVQLQRQGIARARLSFDTLKFTRGVVCVKIWQLLHGVFSRLCKRRAA